MLRSTKACERKGGPFWQNPFYALLLQAEQAISRQIIGRLYYSVVY
jgi:hypothetical protein